MPEVSQKVAETAEITKTAPKPSSKAGEKPEKSSWNCKKPQNSFQNSAQKPEKSREKSSWNCKKSKNSTLTPAIKPEKSREKVAETAEITKTAPKLSPKASKDPAKSSWNHYKSPNSLKKWGFWHNGVGLTTLCQKPHKNGLIDMYWWLSRELTTVECTRTCE